MSPECPNAAEALEASKAHSGWGSAEMVPVASRAELVGHSNVLRSNALNVLKSPQSPPCHLPDAELSAQRSAISYGTNFNYPICPSAF